MGLKLVLQLRFSTKDSTWFPQEKLRLLIAWGLMRLDKSENFIWYESNIDFVTIIITFVPSWNSWIGNMLLIILQTQDTFFSFFPYISAIRGIQSPAGHKCLFLIQSKVQLRSRKLRSYSRIHLWQLVGTGIWTHNLPNSSVNPWATTCPKSWSLSDTVSNDKQLYGTNFKIQFGSRAFGSTFVFNSFFNKGEVYLLPQMSGLGKMGIYCGHFLWLWPELQEAKPRLL